MVDLSYAYLNTRIKGMEAKMLPESLFKQLIQVDSLPEVIGLLEETRLKNFFVDASTRFSGIELVEEAIRLDLVSSLNMLKKHLPKKHSALFSVIANEFYAKNLKTIIFRKALGQKVTEEDLILFGDRREYAKLLQASDLKSLVPLLGLSPDSESLKLFSRSQTVDYRILLKDVDRQYYWSLQGLIGKGDLPTKQIIFAQLEFLNAMMVLRSKKLGVKPSLFYRNAFINQLLKESFEKAIEKFMERYLFDSKEKELAKENLPLLEAIAERKLVQKVLKETRISVMSFSGLLGFVYLKQAELSNIRKIAYAKLYSMPELLEYVYAIS
ncbi:MAG: V-type ATPase subunit [Candidatus Micrarchaeota archaeon]